MLKNQLALVVAIQIACLFLTSNLLDANPVPFVPHDVKKSNLLVVWTDQTRVKAVNLIAVHPERKKVEVIGMPVAKTQKNIDGIVKSVKKNYKKNINFYIQVDQKTFQKASDIIGPFALKGSPITMAEAFEDTPYTRRVGCEQIMRALAQKLSEPETLIKVPVLAWTFMTGVDTNMGPSDLFNLYHNVKSVGPNNIHREIIDV